MASPCTGKAAQPGDTFFGRLRIGSDKSMPALKKLGHSLAGLNIKRRNAISSRFVDKLLEHLWMCDILY
ncbi:EIN3-binding F-box protein 2 [Spatholobus suberectus]|nr:EIN3-binding F-box protein 2 [Spatholobus suberectus]